MKKIVNGVRYDEDKGILIGSYNNIGRGVQSKSDFHFWQASLYRTPRSNRYFLAGDGGPLSRFAQSVGQNSWGYGFDLIPMTREEALEWAERHLDIEVVEKHFDDLIEDA